MQSEQAIILSLLIFLSFVMKKDFWLSGRLLMNGNCLRENGSRDGTWESPVKRDIPLILKTGRL